MKLNWIFSVSGEIVSLTVIYLPGLDAEQFPSGGFLHVPTNVAYVDWTTFKRFDDYHIKGRKDAFQKLTRIYEKCSVIGKDRKVISLHSAD